MILRRTDGVFGATADDASPLHLCYPTGYDPDCACCWLNIPHTEDQHVAETRRAAEAVLATTART